MFFSDQIEMALLVEHQRMLDDIANSEACTGFYKKIKWEITRPSGTYLCGYVYMPGVTNEVVNKLHPIAHGGWTFWNAESGKYGFDCAQVNDYTGTFFARPGQIYRDSNYVLQCIFELINNYNMILKR